jgi:hypothetical protein
MAFLLWGVLKQAPFSPFFVDIIHEAHLAVKQMALKAFIIRPTPDS